MTDHHSDDKDYNLNHFDFNTDEPAHQKTDLEEVAIDNEHSDEGRQEPLVMGEPLVDDGPFTSDHAEAIKINADDKQPEITAPVIPQTRSDFTAGQPQNSGSRSSMATAFALVAMLIAAGAVWLNFDQPDEAKQIATGDQPSSGYNTIINDEILKLRERMAVVELEKDELNQKVNQQNQVLLKMQQHNRTSASQIESLKAELGKMSGRLANQAKMQVSTKPSIKPAAIKTASKVVPTPVKKTAPKQGTQYELPAPLESLPANEIHRSGGDWVVNIASVYSESAANKELTRLRNMGLDAEVAESVVKGKPIYRIRVAGFANRAEAQSQKEQLASQHGIKDAWIHKP